MALNRTTHALNIHSGEAEAGLDGADSERAVAIGSE